MEERLSGGRGPSYVATHHEVTTLARPGQAASRTQPHGNRVVAGPSQDRYWDRPSFGARGYATPLRSLVQLYEIYVSIDVDHLRVGR